MSTDTFPKFVNTQTEDTYALSGRIFTIGSAPECALRLQARGIPPRAAHCIFSEGHYELQALSRETGVAVNGQRIKETYSLSHGDKVAIGPHELEYREHPNDAASPVATSTASPTEELVRVVVALLRNRDEDVSADLVTSVSRLLHCDAARLVGEDPQSRKRETVVRYPPTASLDRFSNRAIDWARKDCRTVLMHETDWIDEGESQTSLEQNAVASVLCAPLRDGTHTLGYLYLDRLKAGSPFTEEDRTFCDSLIPLFTEILLNAQERRRQRETIARLQSRDPAERGGMIYESTAMAQSVALAEKLAGTDSPVLVLGETGTGKELMSRFVHGHSARSQGPFRAINCGAIPENLIESELFGHEKGAFTGASSRKTGLFEAAAGGTILLDEIGELPQALQVKLLRVLQESEVVRVGGTETIKIDVRILAATNRDLTREVSEGRFRQDLFYRLNVLTLSLPPLRERDQDTVLLAEYFLRRYAEQFGLEHKTLSADARRILLSHTWPGNIRELENVVQRAALLSAGRRVQADDISLPQAGMTSQAANPPPATTVLTIKQARSEAESRVIDKALRLTEGNVSQAAKLLEIDRKWLMKKMDDLGIAAEGFRK